ncbi:MAG: rod shape-determining protein [Clostridia bacterium]|nr:rod shape-determining protein [Clostridia bacterium]
MAQIQDIGVDLGTSNVLIYMRGRGIILREPAVVAVDRDMDRVLGVGGDAWRLIGRTPGNIQAIRPLRQGSIVDYELVKTLLTELVTRAVGRRLLARPKAVISVPSGVNEIEKRSIIGIMFDAGMRRTQILERPIAAALGVGMRFDEAYGSMIIDIAAGQTDIAVLSMNEVSVGTTIPIGGDYLDDAIIRYLRKKHNLLIGERTAEDLKINLGSATEPAVEETMEVTGRNLVSGLPRTQKVTAQEIYEALKEPVGDLIESIQAVLERTPPQLAADIFDEGIVLTGGGAALAGLADAVYATLKIPCAVADDPQTSVVMGCGRALEDTPAMRALLNSNRHRWRAR